MSSGNSISTESFALAHRVSCEILAEIIHELKLRKLAVKAEFESFEAKPLPTSAQAHYCTFIYHC